MPNHAQNSELRMREKLLVQLIVDQYPKKNLQTKQPQNLIKPWKSHPYALQ